MAFDGGILVLKIGTEYDHEKPDSGYLVFEQRLHPKPATIYTLQLRWLQN
jgi:hypothetical protein